MECGGGGLFGKLTCSFDPATNAALIPACVGRGLPRSPVRGSHGLHGNERKRKGRQSGTFWRFSPFLRSDGTRPAYANASRRKHHHPNAAALRDS